MNDEHDDDASIDLPDALPGPIAEQLDRMLDEDERIVWVHSPTFMTALAESAAALRRRMNRYVKPLLITAAASALLMFLGIDRLLGNTVFYLTVIVLALSSVPLLMLLLVRPGIQRAFVLTDRRMISLRLGQYGSITYGCHILSRPGWRAARKDARGRWSVLLLHESHKTWGQAMNSDPWDQANRHAIRIEAMEDIDPLRHHLPELRIEEVGDGH